MKKICKQCGKEFELPESEIEFFKSKGLSIPKRCKQCRDSNKKNSTPTAGKQAPSRPVAYTPASRNNSSNLEGNKTLVWIVGIAVVAVLAIAIFAYNMWGTSKTSAELPAVPTTPQKNEVTESTIEKIDSIIDDESEVIEETESSDEIVVDDHETDDPEEAVQEDPVQDEPAQEEAVQEEPTVATYHFRSAKLKSDHYQKHGVEMGFASADDYEAAASAVVTNPDALHKREKEDNDYVFYVEATNEFVIVSTDGYIRTYFLPSGGKSYYDRQ